LSPREKLEVTIVKVGASKYSVTVSWHGMMEISDFGTPYSQEKLRELTQLIGELDETTGRLKASPKELQDIGVKLYNSLFPTEKIRDIVSKCLTTGGESLELELRYKEHEVGIIPWELLHDGTTPLVASGVFDLVRVIEVHEQFREVSVKSPLKILVVIARPLDQLPLEIAPPKSQIVTELEKHIKAGKTVVHFLTPPTYDELVKWLGKGYDIVQFYGHGGFSEEKGCLAFEDKLGFTKLVSAEELAVGLRRSGVQLIVLCACHSGAAPSRDVFTGVAQSLVGASVPAVVGWGYAVPVETALSFMEQFYAALATEGEPSVRNGVAQARRALFPKGTAHFLELFERTLDDRLVQVGTWNPETLSPPYAEPPHNLEEALGIHNLLVGRFSELAELSKAFASQETVVALWGFSGVGKTALAVRGVYDRFMWRFPDGVWYVELQGGKTLDTILSELCNYLKVPAAPSTEEKERLVLDRLAQTKTLLLLNNFEDVETDPRIISFLNKVKAPNKVLLTTRFKPQEMAWRKCSLPQMSPGDALQLFLRVAKREGTQIESTDLDNVLEICRRVDYYPIAIIYVAGSLAGTTLDDVLRSLSKSPPDAIKAGFEYAHDRLSSGAKELLARLSILVRPFQLETIEALSMPSDTNLHIVNWRECKDELRRPDLLLFSHDLFSMLRMTRLLAKEHLTEPRKWHSIAADHFLSQKAIDAFEAFDHLREAERWREAVELVNAAQARLSQHGLGGEVASRLEEAAQIAAAKLGDRQLQSHSLGYLGNTRAGLGKYGEALRDFQKALRIQRDLLEADPRNAGYQSDVATTLNNLGNLLSAMGRREDALKAYTEALEAYRTLLKNDPDNIVYQSNVAMILSNLGNLLSDMGRREDALKDYTEALEAYRKLLKSDPDNVERQSDVAMTLSNLGSLLSNMGSYDEALKRLAEALDICMTLQASDPKNLVYKEQLCSTQFNISLLHERAESLEKAISSVQWVIDQSRRMDYVKGEAEGCLRLADLCLRNGDSVRAEKAVNEALRLTKENDLPDVGDETLVLQGRLLLQQGKTAEAFDRLSVACIISLEHGWKTHNKVVARVVPVLKSLRERGQKEIAEQLANHLVKAWKGKGLDKEIPQFIELIQKAVTET